MDLSSRFHHNNFKNITSLCDKVMQNRIMAGIFGYAGAGKSYALDKFKEDNKGVFKITLGKSTTPKNIFNELLNELRNEKIYRNESRGFLKLLFENEIDKLEGNHLIVIDEASRLEGENLSYLQEIWEMSKFKCGIIVCGHKDFYNSVIKWEAKGTRGVEEFISRINFFVELERPSDFEIEEFFKSMKLDLTRQGREVLDENLRIKRSKRTWRSVTLSVQNNFLK